LALNIFSSFKSKEQAAGGCSGGIDAKKAQVYNRLFVIGLITSRDKGEGKV